jgi:hypothetical protein
MPLHRSMTFRIIRTFTLAGSWPDTDPPRGLDIRNPESPAAPAAARVFRLHGSAARLEMPPGLGRPEAPRTATPGTRARATLERRSPRLVRGR